MKRIPLFCVALSAFALSACRFGPLIEHEKADVTGGTARWFSVSDDGDSFSRPVPTSWAVRPEMRQRRWEGYNNLLQAEFVYQGSIRAVRRILLDQQAPAFARFATEKDRGGVVEVILATVGLQTEVGNPASEVAVEVFVPRDEFIQIGQKVQVRTINPSATGFLAMLLSPPAVYSEGYSLNFRSNAEYSATVIAACDGHVGENQPAFPRIKESSPGIGFSGSYPARCQFIELAVVGDNGVERTTVVMPGSPASPVFRSGDVVMFRTYGNPNNGFADIRMRQQSGTGDYGRYRSRND